jgi:acetyl esterase
MSKISGKYDAINEEFRKLPGFTIPANIFLLRLFNLLVWLQLLFRRSHPGISTRRHETLGPSGQRLRIVEIAPADLDSVAPALVYYHGGGFFLSHAPMHLDAADTYVLGARCRLFMVDYRLSTQAPFPASFDDAYAGLAWVHANAARLKVDSNRIAVIGDSAGGALAAGVAQKARDNAELPLCAQILLYPVTDCACATASAQQFVDTPMWTAGSNRNMWQVYLRGCGYRVGASLAQVPPYASPAQCTDLRGLPPAFVETAEFDPLRDEALDYARRLGESGVSVTLNETRGTVHGIDMVPSSPATIAAIGRRVQAIREIFGTQGGKSG